jgi:hypothetical protein
MDFPNALNDQEGSAQRTVVTVPGKSRARVRTSRLVTQQRFLACFKGSCNVLRASRAAGIDRMAHYQWLRDDPTYPERFREAQQVAVRMLEDEAVRRAFEGDKKLVTYKSKPVRINGEYLYEVVRSDNLLMFLLKAYDRRRFGDKVENTFTQDWSGNLEDLPEEFLKQVLAKLDAQAAAMAAKQIEGGASAVPAAAQTVDVAHAPNGQS